MNELAKRTITGEVVGERLKNLSITLRVINNDKLRDALRLVGEQQRIGIVRPYINSIDDDSNAQVIDIQT